MTEHMCSKFKHHLGITGTFVYFPTCMTAATLATGSKATVDKLDNEIKKLEANYAKADALSKIDSKLELVIRVNELKQNSNDQGWPPRPSQHAHTVNIRSGNCTVQPQPSSQSVQAIRQQVNTFKLLCLCWLLVKGGPVAFPLYSPFGF